MLFKLVIGQIITMLKTGEYDIVTSGVKVGRDIAQSESNAKVVVDKQGRASYFSRSMIPHGGKEFLYHVGIYGFIYKTGEIYKTGTKQL